MLFHMVASVLLSMVAFLTIFLLVKILQQPIRILEISGYWSYHGEQNACYHVKEHKKLGQKLLSKVTLHFVWGLNCVMHSVAWTVERLQNTACPEVAIFQPWTFDLFLAS